MAMYSAYTPINEVIRKHLEDSLVYLELHQRKMLFRIFQIEEPKEIERLTLPVILNGIRLIEATMLSNLEKRMQSGGSLDIGEPKK